MQGAFPSTKIASPSSSESDFSVVEKKMRGGRENVAKILENSVLDLVVSIFFTTFVVQNERETPQSFFNGNERKKPRARFTTNNGANFFLKSLQRYGN